MKKRIFCRMLSIMLMAAMVVTSILPSALVTSAAAPASYTDIAVNQEATVSVSTRTGRYFRFIPQRGGTYEIYSYSLTGDAYVYLLDASGNEIAHDDDGNGGRNFKLTHRLEAGTTYYINACAYGADTASYTFKIVGATLDPAPTPTPTPAGADVWDGTVATGFGSGTGTFADPYLINTAEQLAYLASSTNSGTDYSGKYFKLMSNIDLNNREWTPIGYGSFDEATRPFAGYFDGNFATVTGLKITGEHESAGLFGCTNGATVENLAVTNANVDVYYHLDPVSAGALCGTSHGGSTFRKIYVNGIVKAASNKIDPSHSVLSGLLLGRAIEATTMTDCYGVGTVYGEMTQDWNAYAGGLCGGFDGAMNRCYFNGTVTAKGYDGSYAGGLLGTVWDNATSAVVSNSFAIGTVTAERGTTKSAGGIAASFDSRVPTCTKAYYAATCSPASTAFGTSTSASNFASQSWITTNLGWDFTNVWTFAAGYDYPVLRGFGEVEPTPTPDPDVEADVWDGTVATGFGGGTGTSADPYLIYTAEQLAYLASSTNSGTNYSGKYFRLMSNIDLDNREWTPIGEGILSSAVECTTDIFAGNFDGAAHTVGNLRISTATTSNTGLFGMISGGRIENLGIENVHMDVSITEGYRSKCGALAGYVYDGEIEKCYVKNANISAEAYGEPHAAGCLVGLLRSGASVRNCYAQGMIQSVAHDTNSGVGVLVGSAYSGTTVTIENCYATGSAQAQLVGSASITVAAGGLIGYTGDSSSPEQLNNSFFVGTVSSDRTSGTLCGDNQCTITNSYYSITGSANYTNGTSTSASNFTSQSWIATNLDWDFTNVWTFVSGYDYPVLRGFANGTSEPISPVGSDNILVIRDEDPWGVGSISRMMNELKNLGKIEEWDTVTTSDVTAALLREYGVVYVANVQDTDVQNRIAALKSTLEEYVHDGGTLIFGFATMSGSGGYGSNLPGNVTVVQGSDENNDIADATHPIITGELSDGVALTETDMNGTKASHDYIVASTLPAGSKIIVTRTDGAPTLVEYPLGNGTVIATSMTWEYYAYSTGGLGTFAQKAYDDLFLYALSISNGLNPDPHVHTPGEWVIEVQPTLTTEGLKAKYCTECGALLESETIPVYEGAVVRVDVPNDTLVVGETVIFTVTIEDADPMKSLALVPVFDTDYFEFVRAEWQIQAVISSIVPDTLHSVAAWNTPTDINTIVYNITLRAKALTAGTTIDFTAGMSNDQDQFVPLVIGKTVSIIECIHDNVVCSEVDADYHAITCVRCGYIRNEAHIYDHGCDAQCNLCDHERVVAHDYSAQWSNDGNEHWHECTVCGDVIDREAHAYTVVGSTCDECGYVRYLLGDADNDGDVDSDDAIYVLCHVMFAADYPVSQRCDFNGDGVISSDDAAYLLCYTFFVSEYPLTDAT